ncbi:MAG: PAS domain S-box protein [Nitrospirota bacterium]
MKILIVDDNATDRLLLKYLLEQSGFETAEASDGIEGLKMASHQKPDLIISDANMPRMDGFQFLRSIKHDEKLRGIPFVFYSALYTGYREAELATSLGAEAFIIKPKEPKEFIEELRIIIDEIGQTKIITAKLIEKDEEFLRQYARIVATKLEEKVRELEKACAESRQKEESLQESEARLRSIFRAAPIGIGLVSADRRLLQVNDRLCEITGFSSDELIGQNARILYPTEEDYEYVGKTKYAQIRERGTGTVETRWKRKDGTVIDVLLSSSPIDPADLSRGVTFTALDITDRKHYEELLKKSDQELKKRLKELEEFYNIAVGRESRMIQLKKEMEKLMQELEKYRQ